MRQSGKQMFAVKHLANEGIAYALGLAVCGLPTRDEIDVGLAALDARCARGDHPDEAIEVRNGDEVCRACLRVVD